MKMWAPCSQIENFKAQSIKPSTGPFGVTAWTARSCSQPYLPMGLMKDGSIFYFSKQIKWSTLLLPNVLLFLFLLL